MKNFFSPALAKDIGRSIEAVHPKFATKAFVRDASTGLEALELMARARHIADALHAHLPPKYGDAVDVLVRSLGPEHSSDELLGVGIAPFFYMPHTVFVSTYGLLDFEASMKAQHELTRRFTCEFSIRPFIEKYPEQTLRVLTKWSKDKNAHVRRLVSEGTRPRLPWGSRVRWIDANADRILPLLEALKDDEATAVRRSVANHLNDIAKKDVDWVCDVAERWLEEPTKERRALVSHALRTSIKAGNPRALSLLGFGGKPRIEVTKAAFDPKRVAIGDTTVFRATLASRAKATQTLSVDLVVHFVKANGKPSPKVFKVGRYQLGRDAEVTVSKSISLAVHTTRKPYPGKHTADLSVNGERFPVGAFLVTGS